MKEGATTKPRTIGQRTLAVTLVTALIAVGATAMVATATHTVEECGWERDAGFVDTMYAVVEHEVCVHQLSDGDCRLTYTWTFKVDEWGAPETLWYDWGGSYYWYDDGDAQHGDHAGDDNVRVVEEQGVPAPREWTETWDTGWWNVDSGGDKLWGWSNGVRLQSMATGEEVELGYGPKMKCTG